MNDANVRYAYQNFYDRQKGLTVRITAAYVVEDSGVRYAVAIYTPDANDPSDRFTKVKGRNYSTARLMKNDGVSTLTVYDLIDTTGLNTILADASQAFIRTSDFKHSAIAGSVIANWATDNQERFVMVG